MTLREILVRSEEFLVRKGIENAKGDVRRLLAFGLGLTPIEILLQLDRPLTEEELVTLRPLVARRGQNEPLQHILGTWAFRHLELFVDSRALIPRPETEMLVDLVLARIKGMEAPRVHEVGVGTGCIGLSIKREFPDSDMTGSDISSDALDLCRKNAQSLGIWFPLTQGNLAEFVTPDSLDILVSNPPYIATHELAALSAEVQHDPMLALDGGADGLDLIRTLVEQARTVLKPGGWLLLEHGWDQGDSTRALCEGFEEVATVKDLEGQDRFLVARKP
ncbi:MAG: peptide chain release factor N(5)-glutamine methyltransferase [Fibrobacterota bacterium]|jgi:release factor glutamine methyltransferase